MRASEIERSETAAINRDIVRLHVGHSCVLSTRDLSRHVTVYHVRFGFESRHYDNDLQCRFEAVQKNIEENRVQLN